MDLDVVVGLGSNLGDRLALLRDAVLALEERFVVTARSAVYETAPIGPPQPDYLNAAVRLRANVDVLGVLEALLEIERAAGRVRSAATRWGARTLDLDVLWVSGVIVSTSTLTVPHPRLSERAFALRPLHDVAPEAIDPRTGLPFPEAPPEEAVRRTELRL